MAVQKGASVQLTLTTADTNYHLPDLVAAVDAAISKRCGSLVIQADPANAGNVLMGDALVSGTRYGAKLGAGDAHGISLHFNGASTEGIYLRPDTNAQKVNVEIGLV